MFYFIFSLLTYYRCPSFPSFTCPPHTQPCRLPPCPQSSPYYCLHPWVMHTCMYALWQLEQYLAHSSHSVNSCWLNKLTCDPRETQLSPICLLLQSSTWCMIIIILGENSNEDKSHLEAEMGNLLKFLERKYDWVFDSWLPSHYEQGSKSWKVILLAKTVF